MVSPRSLFTNESFLYSENQALNFQIFVNTNSEKKLSQNERKMIHQAISYFCTFGISKKKTQNVLTFDNCIKTSVFYLFRYYSAFSTFLARITALSVAKKSFFNQIYKGTLSNKISYTKYLEIAFQQNMHNNSDGK